MKQVSNTDINKLYWRFNHIYFSDHKPGLLLYAINNVKASRHLRKILNYLAYSLPCHRLLSLN